MDQQEDQRARGHPNGQTDNIDDGIGAASAKAP
jgi:hypothetical protein